MLLSLVVMAYLKSVEQGWKLLHRARRRHRAGVHPPVVLVADQRLVRDQRDGGVVHHLDRASTWRHVDAGDTSSGDYAKAMLITTVVATTVWLDRHLLTRPETDAVLDRFYRRVRPGGPGWRRVAERLGFGDDRIPGGCPELGQLGGRRGRGVFGGVRRRGVPDRQPATGLALLRRSR